jgi:predicted NUDIX family NTP pyrophosphohydrolase
MRKSAGVLLYRKAEAGLLVLLVHPGGPFWRSRDEGAWSIPKGEYADDEQPIAAALREFTEELGSAPSGTPLPLGEVKQNSSKLVTAFALEGEFDVAGVRSNHFEMEWPPRSGAMQSFPEVDRAEWFDLETARMKIIAGQRPFLDAVEALVSGRRD